MKIVAFRPEVVDDQIEEDHQTSLMGLTHQVLKFLRSPVGMTRGEEQRPVIAPVAAAGKLGQRHQFDRGNPQIDQIIQPFQNPAIIAGGEKAPTWSS